MTGTTDVGDAVDTLAGRCALEAFKYCVEERELTRYLLIKYLWYPYSEM